MLSALSIQAEKKSMFAYKDSLFQFFLIGRTFLSPFFSSLEQIDIPRRDSSVLCTSNLIFFSYSFPFRPPPSLRLNGFAKSGRTDTPFPSLAYFLSSFFLILFFLSASALIAVAY